MTGFERKKRCHILQSEIAAGISLQPPHQGTHSLSQFIISPFYALLNN
jgi:hypothetical protein